MNRNRRTFGDEGRMRACQQHGPEGRSIEAVHRFASKCSVIHVPRSPGRVLDSVLNGSTVPLLDVAPVVVGYEVTLSSLFEKNGGAMNGCFHAATGHAIRPFI